MGLCVEGCAEADQVDVHFNRGQQIEKEGKVSFEVGIILDGYHVVHSFSVTISRSASCLHNTSQMHQGSNLHCLSFNVYELTQKCLKFIIYKNKEYCCKNSGACLKCSPPSPALCKECEGV